MSWSKNEIAMCVVPDGGVVAFSSVELRFRRGVAFILHMILRCLFYFISLVASALTTTTTTTIQHLHTWHAKWKRVSFNFCSVKCTLAHTETAKLIEGTKREKLLSYLRNCLRLLWYTLVLRFFFPLRFLLLFLFSTLPFIVIQMQWNFIRSLEVDCDLFIWAVFSPW